MIVQGVDTAPAVADVVTTGVSVPPQYDAATKQDLISTVSSIEKANHDELGTVGLALMDVDVVFKRDVAENIKQESGKDTVVLLTPSGGQAVSNKVNRFSIEKNLPTLNYWEAKTSTESFLGHLAHDPALPWGLINAVIGIVIVLALVATALPAALKNRRRSARD